MSRNSPTVSIGLPVFNGENFLEQALDSILTQTYSDFELIISDNASTDKTQQICLEHVTKDKRIRYYRNNINVGASKNFNRVFELAKGKYFKWFSHDDLIAPAFLTKCVEVLDSNPSVSLCYSKTGHINGDGELVGSYIHKGRFDSPKVHERFGDLLSMRYPSWVTIFGLMRSSSLRKTQLFKNYIGVDRNLLTEIALTGRFYELSDYLFFRREHDEAYTDKGFANYQEQMSWWVKTNSMARLYFPHWRIFIEYFKSARRASIKWSERQLCYAQILKWLIREGWVLLDWDIGNNVLGRTKHRKRVLPLMKYLIKKSGV